MSSEASDNPVLKVFATNWCGDCKRTWRFLESHGIPYEWINIDHDKTGEQFVLKVNGGKRSVPTILLPNGEILVEPNEAELAAILELI